MTLNGVPLTVIGVIAPPFDADSVPSDGYFLGGDVFIPVAQFPVPRGLHAAGPVDARRRAAQAGRQRRARDLGSGSDPPAARRVGSAALRRRAIVVCRAGWTHARGRAGAGSHRRHVADGALSAARVGRRRAADRVRQRQPAAAGARGRSASAKSRCGSALGASRSAVTRQLAVEAALLAVTASISRLSARTMGACRAELAAAAGVGADPDSCSARRARPALHRRRRAADGDDVRAGAGAADRRGRTSIVCCRPVRAGHRASATGRATC